MNVDAISHEFCELAGICWHERSTHPMCAGTCHKCAQVYKHNPDFTDAREVLRVMRERGDYHDFVKLFGCASIDFNDGVETYFIPDTLIIDTTGLLLEEAVGWMRGRK